MRLTTLKLKPGNSNKRNSKTTVVHGLGFRGKERASERETERERQTEKRERERERQSRERALWRETEEVCSMSEGRPSGKESEHTDKCAEYHTNIINPITGHISA